MIPNIIETKVAAGGASAAVTGLLVWALTTYIPAWHHGIPGQLQAFIPMISSVLLGTVAAYLAPHTSRPAPAATAAPPQTGP